MQPLCKKKVDIFISPCKFPIKLLCLSPLVDVDCLVHVSDDKGCNMKLLMCEKVKVMGYKLAGFPDM